MIQLLRRIITITFWPLIDLVVTLFGNWMLVHSRVWVAILATAFVTMLFNFTLLYLLSFEKAVPRWFEKQIDKISGLHSFLSRMQVGEFVTILIVYVISGPAMAGAPLIWLLGIKGKRAASLVVIGVTLNSILWVGGVYNVLWLLIHEVVVRGRVFF